MTDDGCYTPEEARAIAVFIEELPGLCEERLVAGCRSGDEWIVGDLEGNPGTSLHVNTVKGVFYDHNPTATPQNGGALALFAELCGYSGCDEEEVLVAMVEWARGKDAPAPKSGKSRSEKSRTEREDLFLGAEEEEVRASIDRWERGLAEAEAGRFDARQLRWSTSKETYLAEEKEKLARARERLATVQAQLRDREKLRRAEARKLEKEVAGKWSAEWAELSAASIASKDLLAEYLAGYRGLSVEVFRWMIEEGYLVMDAEASIAFPIVKRGAGVVGMHVRWFGTGGEGGGWRCALSKGTKLSPLIIGELAGADLVAVTESTWDAVAFIDLYELYREKGWAVVVTRGAGNSSKVPARSIEPGASVSLLLQNDEAGEEWYRWLPFVVRRQGYRIAPPEGIKDLNDWMRAVPRAEILQQLTNL
jgi:hypothetical protein